MRNPFSLARASLVGAAVLVPSLASAHISISSGKGVANATQEVAFSVGHGCAGADTIRVVVDIPAGVSSVRPMRSDFGAVSVAKDAAGTITSVTWQKREADFLDADIAFYKLVVRLKAPDQPFTTVVFPTHQTCRTAAGVETTVDWVAPNEDDPNIEPAPQLKVLPASVPGWNKLVVPVAVADVSAFFADAQIVWKGNAAFSSNPSTAQQIAATAGTAPLTSLAANDEIWVKY